MKNKFKFVFEGREEKVMKIDASSMEWIRKPKSCRVTKDKVEIMTEPHTDLWQRTYYHFRNDNAPVLQMKTIDQFFSLFFRLKLKTGVYSIRIVDISNMEYDV